MKKKILVVDEKIELRLPDENYAAELYNIINTQRTYLGKWLPWVPKTNRVEDTQKFLKDARLFNKGGQKLITLIFHEKKIAGSVSLVYISKEHGYAELGYWLSEDSQGKGIMMKSVNRLIDYAFQHMDIHRIEIEAATQNAKSQAIPKNLGFKHEGTMREGTKLHGKYIDTELYSFLRWEWESRKKPDFTKS